MKLAGGPAPVPRERFGAGGAGGDPRLGLRPMGPPDRHGRRDRRPRRTPVGRAGAGGLRRRLRRRLDLIQPDSAARAVTRPAPQRVLRLRTIDANTTLCEHNAELFLWRIWVDDGRHMATVSLSGQNSGPLRGDLRIKSRMEMLQDGYIRAVAAAAGCTMAKPEPDDGIDWVLTHTSTKHPGDPQVDLKVQLKSTSQSQPNPQSGYVSVKLSNARFELLAQNPVIVHRILIALIIPKNVEKWVRASHNYMELRHCAYWVNIAGAKPTGTEESSVRVPTSNVFDDIALCDIMRRVGSGGTP